jgi:hypothetical protein
MRTADSASYSNPKNPISFRSDDVPGFSSRRECPGTGPGETAIPVDK